MNDTIHMPPPLPPLVLTLQQALPEHPIALVGGWVRAWLTGATPEKLARTDIDLAIGQPPAELSTVLTQAGLKFTDEGSRWGTLKVINPEPDLPPIEITALREDAYLPGSRYPQVTFLKSSEKPAANPSETSPWAVDARRRDFTCNAVYLSLDGTLFDPFDGAADLKNGLVSFIGEAETRIAEDPLRWLRFWRFCAFYGVAGATPELLESLAKTAPLLSSLSKRRVTDELTRLEQGPWAGNVHDLWRRHGWEFLLPA